MALLLLAAGIALPALFLWRVAVARGTPPGRAIFSGIGAGLVAVLPASFIFGFVFMDSVHGDPAFGWGMFTAVFGVPLAIVGGVILLFARDSIARK